MVRTITRIYRNFKLTIFHSSNLTRTADYLSAALAKLGFRIMSEGGGRGLPLVAFRLNPEHNHKYDEVSTRAL